MWMDLGLGLSGIMACDYDWSSGIVACLTTDDNQNAPVTEDEDEEYEDVKDNKITNVID